jgi:uncharacterized protein YbaR (Trm112 family)
MKIACPACHLTGSLNELELPPEGRELTCPRCKKAFHVDGPPVAPDQRPMNVCPACQYSTFSEETFVVCPKCGTTEKEFRLRRERRKEETALLQQDGEALHRSYRNPDLVTAAPEEPETALEAAPKPVRIVGWLSMAVAGALVCYGGYGLADYYSKDWQKILSAPLLEPLSRTRVFVRLALLPWLTTLYAIALAVVADRFLRRAPWGRRGLALCAWAGLAVVSIHQAAGFFTWVKIAASSSGILYYLTGIVNALLMTALWGAPFLLLRRALEHDAILAEFPDE